MVPVSFSPENVIIVPSARVSTVGYQRPCAMLGTLVKVFVAGSKIAACAKDPATIATVDASTKLAKDLNVNATPTLLINGRQVTPNASYDTLKQIVEYQEKLDGLTP